MSITSISKTSPNCDTRPLTRGSPSTLLTRRSSKSKSRRHQRGECRARPSLLGITGESGHLHHLREDFDRRSDHPRPAPPRFDLLPHPLRVRVNFYCPVMVPRFRFLGPSGSLFSSVDGDSEHGVIGSGLATRSHILTPAVLLIHTRLVASGIASDHARRIADVTIPSLQLVTSHFTSLYLIVLAIVDALNSILPVNLKLLIVASTNLYGAF